MADAVTPTNLKALKPVQLQFEISQGRLTGYPVVLLDGRPIGILPISDASLTLSRHGFGGWRLHVPAEHGDQAPVQLRTLGGAA